MTLLGYQASHEQFAPSHLLACVRLAERAGFTAAMCSDHFHPWSSRQGQSGFSWTWLGAAMEATTLPFGTVNAPGQRYHPALIAQAAATLAELYPERFWIAVGSGEALNEHVTGEPWPEKRERNARLEECVAIMRALWAGETVTHQGRVRVADARLYTRPLVAPRIIAAALSPETAEWAGRWADGLITVNKERAELRRMIDAFHRGGGEGKGLILQAKVSYARTDAEARRAAHDQWRECVLEPELLANLPTPSDFERAAAAVTVDDVAAKVHCSSDLGRHAAWLRDFVEMGFEEVHVHNVNREQERFIEAFGERVIGEVVEAEVSR